MPRSHGVRSTRLPLIVHSPEVTRGLAQRFGMSHLAGHWSERPIWSLFTFVNGHRLFVPRSPAAAPRHALYGHAIGLICG